MHFLYSLGIAFSVLVTYLETTVQDSKTLNNHTMNAKVIRSDNVASLIHPTSSPTYGSNYDSKLPLETLPHNAEPLVTSDISDMDTLISAALTSEEKITLTKPAKIEQRLKNIADHASKERRQQVKPLNLTVPSPNNTYPLKFKQQKRTIDLFNYSGKPKVTYEAELVYDAEKGEDITGGKIYINIPLG